MASDQHTLSSSATDTAILKYLNKKGYRNAEELSPSSTTVENLAMEIMAEQDSQVATSSLSGGSIIHQPPSITTSNFPYNSPTSSSTQIVLGYEYQFQRMKKWILNSLEIYRIELVSLIFPILIHSYLDLHSRGFSSEAITFLTQQRKEVVLSPAEEDDIDRLLAIKDVVHLRENQLALSFRSYKFNVKLSLYAFELFVTFVNEHRLTLVRKIVNAHINLIVTESYQHHFPSSSAMHLTATTTSSNLNSGGSASLATYPGIPQAEPGKKFVSPSLPRVFWGVPPIPDTVLRVHSSNVPEHAIPVTPTNEHPEMAPSPDLVLGGPKELDSATLLSRLKELSRRVLVGRNLLPSAICYTLHNTYGRITSIRLSSDGALMATGTADSYIDIWSTGRGLPVGKPPCFVLAPLKRSTELSHVDLDSLPSLSEIKESGDNGCWCKSPDGKHIISKRLIGHSGPVTAIRFSFDRHFLLSSSVDGTVRLWSLDTFSSLVLYRGHSGPIWDLSVAISPSYNAPLFFASAGADKTIRVWSSEWLSPLRLLAGHLGDVECVCFHPNNLYLASGSSDRTIRLWDINTGSTVRLFTMGMISFTASIPTVISVSPCGKFLAGGDDVGRVYLWDISNGTCTFSSEDPTSSAASHPITSLAWSMIEGKILASGSLNGSIALWEFHSNTTGKESVDDGTSSTPTNAPLVHLKSLYTKHTPVLELDFSARNLLLVGGVYSPPSTAL